MAETTPPAQATTPQPDPDAMATSQPKSQAQAKGIPKVAAVGKALRKLGKDATRDQIRTFVKEQFGIEMTPDHISNCKSELRKRRLAQKAAKTQPEAVLPVAQPSETVPPQTHVLSVGNGQAGRGISLNDLQVVKELLRRIGAEQLRTLIDLLA